MHPTDETLLKNESGKEIRKNSSTQRDSNPAQHSACGHDLQTLMEFPYGADFELGDKKCPEMPNKLFLWKLKSQEGILLSQTVRIYA